MARAYMNNTNESITYKVWSVKMNNIKLNNLKFLTSQGITARCLYDIESAGLNRAEFETTCDKQESMLKLTYGEDLLLLTVNVVAPNSILHSPV